MSFDIDMTRHAIDSAKDRRVERARAMRAPKARRAHEVAARKLWRQGRRALLVVLRAL